jgi:glycosyltransferase involved in cell wall biosynthesis
MKKKVLFVITKSNWGGAQRYVFDLATNLPKEQFDVAVALGGAGTAGAAEGALAHKLGGAGMRTIFVQSFMRDLSLVREFKALAELRRIIRAERPDVVHLNSSKAGGIGALAARLCGVKKIVFTSHGLPWDEDRDMLARAAIWCASWLTFLLCHTVIVLSADNAGRAALPFCGRKIRLVHNGLAPLAFFERAEARAALGIGAEALVVGTIANLEWNKGLQYLVRAMGDVTREGASIRLYIIGEGEERHFLETLVDDESLNTVVTLAGFKSEAWRYLRAFDIFALPSVKEGLPYVLMEAGQAGLPCVGSDIPGVAEIIADRTSGLLVRPKDHRDLAAKLHELIDDPGLRERMGLALRERVTKEFSLEKMVANTAALY